MEEDVLLPVPPTGVSRYWPVFVFGGISVVCIAVACTLLLKTTTSSVPIRFSEDEHPASPSAHVIVVDVSGAVVSPGVYRLVEGSRVDDALFQAGGLTSDADDVWVARSINRASILTDGAKMFIPKKGSVQGTSVTSLGNVTATQMGISINTASTKELDALPGVGEVTVGKIVAGRPYQRLEELVEKQVMKPSLFEKLKGQLIL